ncbi:MAG: SpoIIIAH-like family protein [Oscillospiraceae bacterium]|nr:SpoIIIAH-like family protein [Oscillospiraceae bacterium]
MQKGEAATAAMSAGRKHAISEQAKKQLTLLCLVAALMGAVYLNWRIETKSAGTLPITETLAENSALLEVISPADENEIAVSDDVGQEQKNYGDTLFVSTDSGNSDSYFAEARLDRTQKRDEALETLEQALKQANLTLAEKERLTAELSAFASAITSESRIENQIIAKGFRDCVVFLQQQSVKVVVQADAGGLTAAQAAQIKEVVLAETELSADKISIVEIAGG